MLAVAPEFPSESELSTLSEQTLLLRTVTENARVGLSIIGPDHTYLYANSTYSEMLGVSTNLVGLRVADVLADVYTDQIAPRLARSFRGERVSDELRRTTPDGDRYYSVRHEPTKAENGISRVVVVLTDVTDRRRAEEALEFERTMLLTERDLTLDGILVVDDQSRVLSFNRRFAEMWGISDEILATRADGVLLSAIVDMLQDAEGFMRRVRELYDQPTVSSHDEAQLRDGRTFARYSAPMRHADGRYYGRVWYFRDITQRKKADTELRRERDRAQRYLDAAEVMILALDTQGRVTQINRKGCEMLGYREDELLGREWIETCLPARIRPRLTGVFQQLLAGDTSIVENVVVTRNGEERLIEWRNRVLADEAGNAIGTLSSGTDITDRKAAEEAVRTAEERMRFALESAGVGVWDTDYITGVARKSEVFERIYGVQSGTFGSTFQDFLDRVHAEDRERVRLTVEDAVRTGRDFTVEHRILWPNGTVRWISSSGRIHRSEHGTPVRGVGIALDVTERRSLEEQYHHAQKMEAVGRLAGGIAHDFNNLLTVINGYSQLLLQDMPSTDPRRADIGAIAGAGDAAARLTSQLLAFSRKQMVQLRELDPNEVVAGVRGIIARVIGEDISVVIETHAHGIIEADRGQMEQVLLNLAVNARDAMPDGGTLTIETRDVDLTDTHAAATVGVKRGHYVSLTVTDTGVGMSPDVQTRLFEPFFTTKPVGKGTGLGLATVHGIVERLGGVIRCQSAVGQGSSFTIYLPHVTPTSSQSEHIKRNSTAATGETVVVVDDDEGVRLLAKRMLEGQGYHVLTAANAADAYSLVEQSPSVRLVLSDVVMAGGNGPALAKRLRALRPAMKIVFMSGFTDIEISPELRGKGVAHIQKPFTADVLSRKLHEAAHRL